MHFDLFPFTFFDFSTLVAIIWQAFFPTSYSIYWIMQGKESETEKVWRP